MRTERGGSPQNDDRLGVEGRARGRDARRRRLSLALAGALAGGWLSGCATISESFTITSPDGSVTTYESKLWIVGGGQTEFISAGDGTTAYSTNGTGLSDNGRAALQEIAGSLAEGAVKGLVP